MRLFVNLYKRGVGGCIAFGYESLREAEQAASGNREQLVVLTDEFPISPDLERKYRTYCERRGKEPRAFLSSVVEAFLNREAS